MASIPALIVDDEPAARQGLRLLLDEDPEIEVVGECADGREAVTAIGDLDPDLVFLDIQMPELDGFGVIDEVGPERMPVVIFVTAYDEYALQAFDVHALDYLLKPFSDERFAAAVRRAKSLIASDDVDDLTRRLIRLLEGRGTRRSGEPVGPDHQAGYLDRLMVKRRGVISFVETETIDWIEAAGDYVRLHVGDDSHLIRETMKGLEAKLDPAKFVRTHRSMIVNIDRIEELEPYFHGDYIIKLRDGTKLKLSRGRREDLERRLGGRL